MGETVMDRLVCAGFLYVFVIISGKDWEADFLDYRGCYSAGSLTTGYMVSQSVGGPYDCYEACHRDKKQQFDVYLQESDCYCVPKDVARGHLVTFDQCTAAKLCEASWSFCGSKVGNFYSVYDIPQRTIFLGTIVQGQCFLASFLKDADLGILDTVCSDDRDNNICLGNSDIDRTLHVVSGNFTRANETCHSTRPGGRLPSYIDLHNVTARESLLKEMADHPISRDTQFYVDLSRESSPFWTNGRCFTHELNITKNPENSDCIALEISTDGRIHFVTRQCEEDHRYICSCESAVQGAGETDKPEPDSAEDDIKVAIAAGVAGLVCLAIFIVVAMVLYHLKRSGKLKGRKSSTIHSASRSGEWDQGEESSSRTRETSVDHGDTRVTGPGTRTGPQAVYENTAAIVPGSSTANRDVNSKSMPGENGSLGRNKAKTGNRRIDVAGIADYSEVKPLNADYSEVDLTEEPKGPSEFTISEYAEPGTDSGGYATPKSNRKGKAPKIDETGYATPKSQTKGGKKRGNANRAADRGEYAEVELDNDITPKVNSGQSNANEYGDPNLTRHAGPMGDIYTDVGGEHGHANDDPNLTHHAGPVGDIYTEVSRETGVVVVTAGKAQSKTSEYSVPSSVPAKSDKTAEGKDKSTAKETTGVTGPLGDIYAEVQK